MTISFSLELPTQRVDAIPEFVTAEAISEIARVAEASGFRAVHVTDHLAVISAVGTRDYYRALGFEDDGLYQRRFLD